MKMNSKGRGIFEARKITRQVICNSIRGTLRGRQLHQVSCSR
jgi:hypothetical protein